MFYTLEALQAGRGDCLILHYGSRKHPRFLLIDGGPVGIFKAPLQPRLNALKAAWSPEGALPLQMVMVSHVDDDHIRGILDLTGMLTDCLDDERPLPFAIRTLWHNSFDDILGNADDKLFAALAAAAKSVAAGGAAPAGLHLSRPGALILVSIAQGRALRKQAERLGLRTNHPFDGLVMTPTSGARTITLAGGLTLTVLAPSRDRIEALHAQWARALKKKASGAKGRALAAAFTDASVFNLSSIVVLAKLKRKTMLLTGDARGDDILAGLRAAGLLKNGGIHVDVLKLPHHGSDRNVETDFFRRITADHYVVSGNGEFGNPEVATLSMLSEARGKANFTLHLTNRDGKNNLGTRLDNFFAAEKTRGRKYKVVFRTGKALSLLVDLLDPVTY